MIRTPIRSPHSFARRLTVTIIAFVLLSLIPLALAAPSSVIVPLGTVLGLGLLVGGGFMLADRRRRPRVLITSSHRGIRC
jgi:hypothetical protein